MYFSQKRPSTPPGCVCSCPIKRECRFLRRHFLPMRRAQEAFYTISLPTLTKLPSPSFYRHVSSPFTRRCASHCLSTAARSHRERLVTLLSISFRSRHSGNWENYISGQAESAVREERRRAGRGREPCRNNSGHSYYILAASTNCGLGISLMIPRKEKGL